MTDHPDKNQPSLNRRLIDAAVAGDLAEVCRLLDAGAETHVSLDASREAVQTTPSLQSGLRHDVHDLILLHVGNKRLNAAMYLAAFHGYDDIVEHFLGRAAQDPMTLRAALFGAVRSGKEALVKKLVDAGAEPDFHNDYPLRRSIKEGHENVALFLARQTGAQERAVNYAAAAGQPCIMAAFLTDETDVGAALEAAAQALNPMVPTGRAGRPVADIIAGVHMLLGFAAARGDNMQEHLVTVATAAAKQKSLCLINEIRKLDELQDVPDKNAVLGAMLLPYEQALGTPAEYSDAMVHLIEDGADPYKGLMLGIAQCDVPMVDAATTRRADPRRHQYAALQAARDMADKAVQSGAPALQILGDVLAAEAFHAIKDDMVYKDGLSGDNPLQIWRAVEEKSGKSGLMSVFAIGQAGKYFDLLARAGEKPNLDDVLHQDKTGYRALDCLYDAGQLDLLFTPSFWQDRRDDYQKLWQALTPLQQESVQDAHAGLTQRWAAAEDHARVSILARQHKNRFKL